MSEYTTTLRWWCTSLNNNDTSLSVKQNIELALPKIFNFDFPIFNENYREELEFKIIHHFYFREIGFETPGLFREYLNMKLNEIMPYYNQRYQSELLTYNPFDNINITTVGSTSGNNTQSTSTNGTGSVNGNDSSAYSDTPQNGLTDVDNLNYLTNYTKNTNGSETATSSEGSTAAHNDGNYEETKTGKDSQTSFMELLTQYRKTFLNIDMEVIHELDNLFMNVY